MTIELESKIFGKTIPFTRRVLARGEKITYKVEEKSVMGLTVVSPVEVVVADRDTLKISKTNPLLRHLADEENPDKGVDPKVLSKNEITDVRLPKKYPFVRRVFKWIPD